jgi:hypothetical protein
VKKENDNMQIEARQVFQLQFFPFHLYLQRINVDVVVVAGNSVGT